MRSRQWPKVLALAAWLGAWSFLVAASYCGNGVVEFGEQCDDGNTTSAHGCSSTCQIETGWTCTGSKSVCTPICGDGRVVGNEQCDDGNTTPCDGCSATCKIEQCGNGVKECSEQCDDGNKLPYDGCSADCLTEAATTCQDATETEVRTAAASDPLFNDMLSKAAGLGYTTASGQWLGGLKCTEGGSFKTYVGFLPKQVNEMGAVITYRTDMEQGNRVVLIYTSGGNDRYQHMIGAALTVDIDTSNNSVTFSDTQTGQSLANATPNQIPRTPLSRSWSGN